ncbi:retinaldehyde-binding protein 1-like [Anticarsia gemmatalis]|uniref:retinaldehyde-binding protein 1-like n=1 Tax=Anticarsia gemmatalis TaxID=129554 RepID=UPI003F7660DD
MERLIETPLLKFNPNTLEEVRKELNLHQAGVLDQMIANFEEWISKQNHFTRKQFGRHYLETSIVLGKGSLERAKKTLDKLCTLKTLLPQFFTKHDAKNELVDSTSFAIQATMPRLTKDNYRVYCVKLASSNFDSTMLFDFHRFAILMSEYVKSNDYSHGFVCVLDCRDVNIVNVVTKINVLDLRNSMSVLMEGYGMRVKGIHIISSSKMIDTFVSLLKQVISAKIANRINVHATVEALHEHVPKDILPQEYGGNEKPLREVHENWLNVLSQKENVAFFREICKAGTNEKFRLTANYNDQILGMPGSFRTLTVD